MIDQIPAEKMKTYRAAARQRREQRASQLEARQRQIWRIARRAASLLQEQFGTGQVIVFGSILYPERFHHRSDLDLAVWGLAERDYYRAVSYLLELDPAIPVDLVQMEFAPPALLSVIEEEGVYL